MAAIAQKAKGLSRSHGTYKRSLFPDCSGPLDQCLTACNHVDYVYRRRTLPWLPGVNIISTPLFLEFTTKMNEALSQLDTARQELKGKWDVMVLAGIRNSAGTANKEEYPKVEDLDDYYKMTLTYYPVHSTSDWRVTLPNHVVEDIREKLEEDTTRRLAEATTEIWRRLTAEIETAYKNLDGKRLRPEWLPRIQELAVSIPDLNLANDPDLNDAAKKALELTQHDIEALREDKDLRKETTDKAQELYESLKDIF
jgi:hypothetical protein